MNCFRYLPRGELSLPLLPFSANCRGRRSATSGGDDCISARGISICIYSRTVLDLLKIKTAGSKCHTLDEHENFAICREIIPQCPLMLSAPPACGVSSELLFDTSLLLHIPKTASPTWDTCGSDPLVSSNAWLHVEAVLKEHQRAWFRLSHPCVFIARLWGVPGAQQALPFLCPCYHSCQGVCAWAKS